MDSIDSEQADEFQQQLEYLQDELDYCEREILSDVDQWAVQSVFPAVELIIDNLHSWGIDCDINLTRDLEFDNSGPPFESGFILGILVDDYGNTSPNYITKNLFTKALSCVQGSGSICDMTVTVDSGLSNITFKFYCVKSELDNDDKEMVIDYILNGGHKLEVSNLVRQVSADISMDKVDELKLLVDDYKSDVEQYLHQWLDEVS